MAVKYFKVEGELLDKISKELEKRNTVIDSYKAFGKLIGEDSITFDNDLYFGVSFIGFVREGDSTELDTSKWKTKKCRRGKLLEPKKTNKPFYKLYVDNVPKEKFSYEKILSMIIEGDYDIFTGRIGLKAYPNKYFGFTTSSYTPKNGVIEITATEYENLGKKGA